MRAKAEVASRVTILIKTFQRPRTVNAAIASIRRFYPTVPIIVADDSGEPTPIRDNSVVVHRLPFDSGVSKGRNFLFSHVRTKYFLMSDDDNLFTRHTRLERMVDSARGGELRYPRLSGSRRNLVAARAQDLAPANNRFPNGP